MTAATPASWRPTRLRFVVRLNPSKTEIGEVEADQEVSFIPMEAIGEDGSLRLDQVRPLSQVQNGYSYFRDGDVTIAKITPCFENGKGALMANLHGGIGFGTTELIVVRPVQGLANGEFLQWLFQSPDFRLAGQGWMYGAGGQKRVPDDFVLDYRLALPPVSEQTIVSAFLDRETVKIDALVEEQRRLIKLLKEKRQAVISHAVTRGLNPNTKTKQSGLEWLGDIPEHWEVVPLKRLCNIRYGIGEPPSYHDSGTPLIRATNVDAGKILTRGLVYVDPTEIPATRIVWLQAGDIVVVRSGAYTGDSAIVPPGFGEAIAGFDMVVRPTRVAPAFLQLALLSGYLKSCQIDLQRMRAAQPHLNAEELGNCFVALPPVPEQAAIIKAVYSRAEALDRLLSEAERGIDLLQERRASLVSAAIGSAIDLRKAGTEPELVA